MESKDEEFLKNFFVEMGRFEIVDRIFTSVEIESSQHFGCCWFDQAKENTGSDLHYFSILVPFYVGGWWSNCVITRRDVSEQSLDTEQWLGEAGPG